MLWENISFDDRFKFEIWNFNRNSSDALTHERNLWMVMPNKMNFQNIIDVGRTEDSVCLNLFQEFDWVYKYVAVDN